jgi:hypothetical protein
MSLDVLSRLALEKVVQSVGQVFVWQISFGTMSKKELLLPVRIDSCVTIEKVQLSLFDSPIIWLFVVITRLSGFQNVSQSSNEVINVLIL